MEDYIYVGNKDRKERNCDNCPNHIVKDECVACEFEKFIECCERIVENDDKD